MKKLLPLLLLFLTSCVSNQWIFYATSEIVVPKGVKPIHINVNMKILTDNRANVKGNRVLFKSPRALKIKEIDVCINAEKHYHKEPVAKQITELMVKHFNLAKLFTHTNYNDTTGCDYYLTGTLNKFYGEQQYSDAKFAAIAGSAIFGGVLGGTIAGIATANIKTPGKIVIEISDLKLFRKDSVLIKDFGSFYKEYKEEFPVDLNCWCIYRNANDKLNDFNTQLTEKIRADMWSIVYLLPAP